MEHLIDATSSTMSLVAPVRNDSEEQIRSKTYELYPEFVFSSTFSMLEVGHTYVIDGRSVHYDTNGIMVPIRDRHEETYARA